MWSSFSAPPGRPLLLLLLLLPLLFLRLTAACPESCSCLPGNSIMCSERRSSVMPGAIPVSTQHLYIFENGVGTLSEDDFAGLDALELLDLSQNQLVALPDGVFGQLSSLRNLDLSSNQIAHVSEHSFSGLVRLERLYLYSNRIQSIHPAAFEGLDQLLELKLQLNALTALPPMRLPRLLLLDISHNRIPPPGAADLRTPNLESLRMADLGLAGLDEELMSSLTNLHVLDLSQNKLTAMPAALRSVRGLIRLSLASNPLGQLAKEDFENLVALQGLDLSNLNLQGFPEGFFQLFPKLNHLTVAGNPFNCLCPLAWFPGWVRGQSVELARREETRCHFPPSNSGKVLADLERRDFGCPVTTAATARTRPPVPSSTPAAPLPPTARAGTTTTAAAAASVHTPSPPDAQGPAASPSTAYRYRPRPADKELLCPANICLNGGTCKFNPQGQVECLCPPDTAGLYCENRDESPSHSSPPVEATAGTAAATPEPDISSRQVTSTSILLDLNRYIATRPHIRGIRLTYRKLSGPDQRAQTLHIPANFPEYTLRGLRPNCTYSVCASAMGEPGGAGSSCTEARTTGAPVASPMEPRVVDPVAPPLVLALAGLALVMVATAVVAALVFLRRRRRSKAAHVELDGDEPAPTLELEGVKACLENGALPHKQPEIIAPCPPQPTTTTTPTSMPNGVQEYEALLMQGQGNANNNVASLKPSYF